MDIKLEELEVEFRKFQEVRHELSKTHEGKFVLIKAEEIIGIFNNDKEAIEAGVDQFGDTPFFVSEITEKEFVIHFLPQLTMAEL